MNDQVELNNRTEYTQFTFNANCLSKYYLIISHVYFQFKFFLIIIIYNFFFCGIIFIFTSLLMYNHHANYLLSICNILLPLLNYVFTKE